MKAFNNIRKTSYILRNKFIKTIFIVSCVIAILYPLVNTYVIFPAFTNLLIENTENKALSVGKHLSSMFSINKSELTKQNISMHFSKDKTHHLLEDFHLTKLRVFSPSGEILYSTNPEEIGRINEKTYFHNIVARGGTYSKVVKKDSQTADGSVVTHDVVETYVPVMTNNKFSGAFEIYSDITSTNRKLKETMSWSSSIPLLLMFVFLFTIIVILVKADKSPADDQEGGLPMKYRSPFYPLLLITISIFLAETAVMFIISSFPFISTLQEALIDSMLLVMIVSPTLYLFLFRPLLQHVSYRKDAEERIQQMAYYDELTGLPNRSLFKDRLTNAIAQAIRYNRTLSILYLDIDNFKRINDTFDHRMGDLLIKEIAERLTGCIRLSDAASHSSKRDSAASSTARLGGDEFALLLSEINSPEDASRVAQRILGVMSRPFNLGGHEVFITASIGIAVYPQDGDNINTLTKNVDTAMYNAKFSGRNNFRFYRESMNASALKSLELENDIRKALERDEFLLYYQPQVNLTSGNIVGVEALIRWLHPEKGLVQPGDFIPVAEENGLIGLIGEWVLKTACWQSKIWRNTGFPPVRISINLSSQEFNQGLIPLISKCIEKYSIDPGFLDLEITESVLMQNRETTVDLLHELKKMGLRISMDDFGTGYSSFNYLKNFPLDVIKIDRSFIMEIPGNPDDAAIVDAIIAMAHRLNMKVIAEGVETEQQLAFLKDHGCDEVQGFLISRPVPTEEVTWILSGAKAVGGKL